MACHRVGIRGRTVELYVQFVDSAGNPTNADDTPQVEIRDSAGTILQASTNLGVGLSNGQAGLYYLIYTIPETAADGYAEDKWTAEIGGVEIENTFEFLISTSGDVDDSCPPDFTPGDLVAWDFSKEESYGINILLRLVKARVKNNGTRKVREGDHYIDIPCNIFTDDELVCFLVNSLSSFNQYPHFTQFTFADPAIYGIFSEIITQGGVLLALAAQSLIEKGKEFTITDNGVAYQPPMVADLLSSQYSAQLADYKEKLKMIKNSIKPAPRGQGTFRSLGMNPSYLRLRHLRSHQIV